MLPQVRSPLTLTDLWLSIWNCRDDRSEEFEQAFAAFFDFPYGLIFPYARSALHALITAAGWRTQKILCPAYTCAVVPLTIALSQNAAELVDSAPDHFLPGVAEWKKKVTPDTRMMIVTPLYGYPVDKSSETRARETAPGIFVLYDEAQAVGASDGAGWQARDADGALFSLGIGKLLPALSGGVLLLRDASGYREIRALRDSRCTKPALSKLTRRVLRAVAVWAALREPVFSVLLRAGRIFPAFSFDRIGDRELTETEFPRDVLSLPSSYQVQIGLRQLERLNLLTATRRKIGAYYDRRLGEEGFQTFPHGAIPTWTRYPLAVGDRSKVIAVSANGGIQLGSFLRYSCASAAIVQNDPSSCRNSRKWSRCMVNLPNWQGISIADAERCVTLLLRLRDQDRHAVALPVAAE